jgi:hypothetical protein
MRMIVRSMAILCSLALAGCGSNPRIQVQGLLMKGGSLLKPPEGASTQVVFVAMDVKGDPERSIGVNEPFAASVNDEEGTFEVLGPDGRGIPPGKYRVSVTQKYRTKHTIDRPKARGEAPINRDTDLLDDRYSPTGSPLIVEVVDSTQIVVDLDRSTASPKP